MSLNVKGERRRLIFAKSFVESGSAGLSKGHSLLLSSATSLSRKEGKGAFTPIIAEKFLKGATRDKEGGITSKSMRQIGIAEGLKAGSLCDAACMKGRRS